MDETSSDEKIVLITGASSGIGKACAEYLVQHGHRVIGTSRRAPLPPEAVHPGSPQMIRMDVSKDALVRRGVDFILQEAGHLDVVVNNAGVGIAGAVEDTSVEEAKELFETNFFGVLRVCRAVLPAMRERRSGLIINVSSIGGSIGLPYQGLYSATKFAVEGMTEALRMEVQPFGIHVVLVEPGDIRTPFTAHRRMVSGSQEESPYAPYCERVMKVVEANERNGAAPQEVAHLLERIIGHPSPRPRYTVGAATQRLAAALKGVVPDRLFEWAVMTSYKIL